MNRSLRKSGILSIVFVYMWIFLIFPLNANLYAQDQAKDATTACADGELAASSNTSTGSWFAIGCFFGLVGWLVAYVMEPSPSAATLLGKSPEYVALYTDCYKNKAKSIRSKNALIGCLVGTGVAVILDVIIIAAAASSE